MKIAKERTIYDNYDLWETYPDEELKEMALENGWVEEGDELSDEEMWRMRYEEDNWIWEVVKNEMEKFFANKTVGFFGEVGRWNGVFKTGQIGDFWVLFDAATSDCDYIKLYDENGHFYLTCSHHDGTCHFEVKEITDEGVDYLDRWEYDWDDKRTEQYVHNQIYKRYSKLPHYAHKQFGCKVREYEPQSKEAFIRILNNKAQSFYS